MEKMTLVGYLKKYTMIIVLILVTLIYVVMTDGGFLSPMNISNLVSQNAYIFVLATGMLFCILTGGNIDLSVGSLVCFIGSVGALLMVNAQMNVFLVIITMFLIGIALGAFQGFWIGYVRIPPFVVTLACMLIFRGLSNVVLSGQTVSIADETLFLSIFGGGSDCYIPDIFGGGDLNITAIVIGAICTIVYIVFSIRSFNIARKMQPEKKHIGKIVVMVIVSAVIMFFSFGFAMYKGIPSVLIWVSLVVAVYSFIASKTPTGRYFYAVGDNEIAAKLSGINTNKVYFLAYTNMGLLSALAAMITVARMTSAQPTLGTNYEMDAIASCFIAGVSAYGGSGKVSWVIIGATLMGIINLGMSLMGVDQNMQKVIKGAILLAAVIFDVVSKRSGRFIVK